MAVHLRSTAGEISRSLWLDVEGHLSSQPHWLAREQALVLASNQQLVMGTSTRSTPR
ncbi:MAG: hypothetical protein WBN89_09790 [Prochlorococcaceae cyanobacterium]